MPESANLCSYSGPFFYNILQVYKTDIDLYKIIEC